MEQITKQQLILVCLLVAIVTAVTTSVATVSLTDNSSGPDQTIYQVIEKTIDRVADIPTVKNIVGTPEVKTPTVTELSPADIADQKSDSLVRIYETIGETKQFIALGLAIGSKNAVLASSLPESVLPEHQFTAVTSAGKEIPLKFEKSGLSNNFAVFTLQYAQGEKNKIPTLVLKSITGIKLGSNIVALGGKESGDVVSTGIVTEIKSADENASSTKNILVTDMILTTPISGWLLFDTGGNLIAFEKKASETESSPVFVNAKLLVDEVKDYL
ncbi:MAG: hypothetical protein JWP09_609 [Candidatus Taylorbacteria bacterium]|nr:hypothetical protein [Candidatus Taylorbacteria bacterium]